MFGSSIWSHGENVALVKSLSELDIGGSPISLRLTVAWWNWMKIIKYVQIAAVIWNWLESEVIFATSCEK